MHTKRYCTHRHRHRSSEFTAESLRKWNSGVVVGHPWVPGAALHRCTAGSVRDTCHGAGASSSSCGSWSCKPDVHCTSSLWHHRHQHHRHHRHLASPATGREWDQSWGGSRDTCLSFPRPITLCWRHSVRRQLALA